MSEKEISVGHYLGFEILVGFNFLTKNYYANLKCNHSYIVELGNDPSGNITRIDNELNRIDSYLENTKGRLETTIQQFEIAKVEMKKPFNQEEELKQAMQRLREVNEELKIDEKDSQIIDDGNNNPEENKKNRKKFE